MLDQRLSPSKSWRLWGVTLGLMIWQRSSKMKLRVNSVIIIMLAFVLSNIVSILHASHKLAALRESFKYIEYETLLVLGFLVASAVSGDLVEQATASASTILLLFVSTSVVLQLLTQSEVSGVWFNNVAIPRLSGALEGPNQLSGLLKILLPVVILIPNNRLITRETKRVSLALGAFALVLSQSRFGIALVIAIGVTLFIKKKRALAYAFWLRNIGWNCNFRILVHLCGFFALHRQAVVNQNRHK